MMINVRNILMLCVALVFAAGTALFVKSWLESERSQFAAIKNTEVEVVEAPSVEILVARGDMTAGTFLKPDMLEWQAWPEDGVHETHIAREPDDEKNEDYEDPIASFDGAVARIGLRGGEPITKARVVHPGERGFLAAVLEPGYRAVSVPVDATSGISGFVFPGDWVDVVMTMQMRDEREGKRQQRHFAQTVLERVRVLAIDQTVQKEDGDIALAKTTTLEVSPKEAERIAVALDMGKLSLSLHSLSPAEAEKAHQERLIGGDQPLDPKLVRNKRRSFTLDTEVYHMWGDPRLFPTKSKSNEIHVMRGSEAEVQKF